jgi:hypothetical protein
VNALGASGVNILAFHNQKEEGVMQLSPRPIFAACAALVVAASASPALAAGGPAVSHRAVRTGSSAWSVVPSPNKGMGGFLNGVSCVPGSGCTAAGYYAKTVNGIEGQRTLVESNSAGS